MKPLSVRSLHSVFAPVLSEPVHTKVRWRRRPAGRGEVSVAAGLHLASSAAHLLPDTARADFENFLTLQGIPRAGGVRLRIALETRMAPDEHRVVVSPHGLRLTAGGPGGLRRALVWLEDEMLARGGPLLPRGVHHRRPLVATRLSRCFFGPINRPPFCRNELDDDVDYYPEPYLDRLSHDGITGLWITVNFRESVPSRLLPGYGAKAWRHLAKLRQTVERCARHGIKVYVFCIEPAALPLASPVLREHPELRGHVIDNQAAFCTGSDVGRAYLEESARTLFREVPGLGGMIVIPVGERFTNCVSVPLGWGQEPRPPITCERCAGRDPDAVLADVLAGFRRGLDQVDPSAELIAWPYSQMVLWGRERTERFAAHVPRGVILQHNFESGGHARQLGKLRPLWDYWLSWPGPSAIFRRMAQRAGRSGKSIFAKLQVGNSHEIATVPYVPVPGLLYRKYRALHRLGIRGAMQSWYFGNYPSLMTRAAGLLSFAPLPRTENGFLRELARREWGPQNALVARAWAKFSRAYTNYPATHFFGYYAPVQAGVTWPLHLVPRNKPLFPTWKAGYPPSGDYLAECLSSHFTLREAATLCARMARGWSGGLLDLRAAYDKASPRTAAQLRELHVAEAVGLHFTNAAEILRFYLLRERLAAAHAPRRRLAILDEMEKAVRMDIVRRRAYLRLMRLEPVLGYHSEAETFKVTPALVRCGIRDLQHLLRRDFPAVRRKAGEKGELFGDYTGSAPQGPRLVAMRAASDPWPRMPRGAPVDKVWARAAAQPMRHMLRQKSAGWVPLRTRARDDGAAWRAVEWRGRIFFRVDVRVAEGSQGGELDSVLLDIEPARLRPRLRFAFDSRGRKASLCDDGCAAEAPDFGAAGFSAAGLWSVCFSIPLRSLGLSCWRKPLRVCVRVLTGPLPGTTGRCEISWTRRHPVPPRLAWEDFNPATDYGWLLPATTTRLP